LYILSKSTIHNTGEG